MNEVDITVVGAGVIGLSIAAEVSAENRRVLVLEKNPSFGQETSSRNSGVVHAGLYYPKDSLKARLCVEGNRLLYELCDRYSIPFRKLGKIIVAVDDAEMEHLEALRRQGQENGVEGLRLLSRKEMRALEPEVQAKAALLSPFTGIVDPHAVMRLFLFKAKERGVLVAYRCEVVGICAREMGYEVRTKDQDGSASLISRVVINSAGLNSERVAGLVGVDTERAGYRLHYCKGEYFSLSASKSDIVKRLVYPAPEAGGPGLGIHITPDLGGRIRLGPNARYVRDIDYRVDESQKRLFHQAITRFLPGIRVDDLEPDFAGIRPKLQGPGEGFRDFIVKDEGDNGFPGLIDLIGIESPGLTSAPAVARYVKGLADQRL